MAIYNIFDIGHTAIAQFKCVSIEYFVELMVRWEAFVHCLEERFANICFYVLGERWAVPGNMPFSRFSILFVFFLIL